MPGAILRQKAFAKISAAIAYRDAKRAISIEKRALFNFGQRFDNGGRRLAEEEEHNMPAAKFIEMNHLSGIFCCQEPGRGFTDSDHCPVPELWRANSRNSCAILCTAVIKVSANTVASQIANGKTPDRVS